MTPWKMAMEAAARMALVSPAGPFATEAEVEAAAAHGKGIAHDIQCIPEPPEFRAAREADEAEITRLRNENAALTRQRDALREALEWLNAELDAYWNDHTQAGKRPPEAYIQRITAAQIACGAALKGAPDA